MAKFKGIITALITPFKDNKVYEKGVENQIKYLASYGIKNVFVCGSYGAFPTMTTKERKIVAEIALEACSKYKLKSIIHIGSPSLETSYDLAQHADMCGADAVSSVVPFYYSSTFYDEKTYIKYFKELVMAVDTDVHCYNNPKTTGYNVGPGLLEKLIDVGVTGIKDGGSNMGDMLKMLSVVDLKKFDYYPSSTSSLITGFLLGVKSCISGVSLSVPYLVRSIYDDMISGKIDDALKSWKMVMRVRSVLGEFGPRAISAYEVLNYKGIDVGRCREPWLELNGDSADKLIRKLAIIGAIE